MAEDDGLKSIHGKHALPIQSGKLCRFASQSSGLHVPHIFHILSASSKLQPYIGNDKYICTNFCVSQNEQGYEHSTEAFLGFAGASSSATGGEDALPPCKADNNHSLNDSSGKNGLAEGSSKPAD